MVNKEAVYQNVSSAWRKGLALKKASNGIPGDGPRSLFLVTIPGSSTTLAAHRHKATLQRRYPSAWKNYLVVLEVLIFYSVFGYKWQFSSLKGKEIQIYN